MLVCRQGYMNMRASCRCFNKLLNIIQMQRCLLKIPVHLRLQLRPSCRSRPYLVSAFTYTCIMSLSLVILVSQIHIMTLIVELCTRLLLCDSWKRVIRPDHPRLAIEISFGWSSDSSYKFQVSSISAERLPSCEGSKLGWFWLFSLVRPVA